MADEVNISFKFVVPVDQVLEKARAMAAGSDPDERAVGSAVVELTDITQRTMVAVADTSGKGEYDLAAYLDHPFGAAVETAKRLASSQDPGVRDVARSLIDQALSVVTSKMALQQSVRNRGK